MHFYDDPSFSFVHAVEDECLEHRDVEDDIETVLFEGEDGESDIELSDDEFELKCEEERIRVPRVFENTEDED